MNQNRLFRLGKAKLLLLAGLVISLFGYAEMKAQPTSYCQTWNHSDVSTHYDWSYYGSIKEVTVTKNSTGQVVMDRLSDPPYYGEPYVQTGVQCDMKLQNAYTITVLTNCMYPYGYSGYVRVWIDYNQNGSFSDPGEFLGSTYYYPPYGSYGTTVNFTVNASCSTTPGLTGMRIACTYAYNFGSDPCVNGYYYPQYGYEYTYGEVEDYVVNFMADIEAMSPPNKAILYANELYDGTTRLKDGVMKTFDKPWVRMGSTQPSGTYLNYKIMGPLPSTNTVYTWLDQSTGTSNISLANKRSDTAKRSSGRYSYSNDGSFLSDQGGTYRVAVSVFGAGCPGESYSTFTVSWPYDLSVLDIASPKNNSAPRFFKYLRGQTIRVTGTVQNVGVNDVGEFNVFAYITDMQGNVIYRDSVYYNARTDPSKSILHGGDQVDIEFKRFNNLNVGLYKVKICCQMLDATDQEAYNDCLPRQDEPNYIVEIAYEIELSANKILRPAQDQVLIGNRPMVPLGEFKNNGVGDASDIPTKLVIYKLPDLTNIYWQSNRLVQDVPAGKYNTNQSEYDVLTLSETGTYKACLIITHPDDVIRTNDTNCITFTVVGGLVGDYTVGQLNSGVANNFISIDSAMNALYYRGLAGDVNFLLTDDAYTVKGKIQNDAAWDFSSWIINSGYNPDSRQTNHITWKPSLQKSLSRGTVTINLDAPSGKGVMFGQSMSPQNTYAIYNEVFYRGSLAKKYANNQGFITFDGGPQKSLKFRITSRSKALAVPFYLGRGSHDISIKNVIIENATQNLAGNTQIPMTQFSPTYGFSFQPDTAVSGSNVFGYSAGVVNRGTLFGTEDAMRLRIDTIANYNNVVSGNDISGFGYGVVGLGIGQLWVENDAQFLHYYNHNNSYNGNTISSCGRAGIYLGYEENSTVSGNRIYAIGGNNNMQTAGIMAGGDGNDTYKGYHNIALNINSNEISGVTSQTLAQGIKIEQDRNQYPHPTLTVYNFPDVNEAMKISNNAVWGILTTTTNSDRFGINVYTQRSGSWWTPAIQDYYSRGDSIVNNTVVMGNNGGQLTTGFTAALGLLFTKSTALHNNALACTDLGVDYGSPAYCGIMFQGQMPANGGIQSDRNAFWAPTGAKASFVRFSEIDEFNTEVDRGGRDDFMKRAQWTNWTLQDQNSVEGNFVNDLTYTQPEPLKLRINMNPQPPIGSILNNRGDRISWVTTDIDGNTRGTLGQRYDIGASEFTGRMYITDVEVLGIIAPAAYKAGLGRFADGEYIMTTAPVNVVANLRNNGNLQQSGIDVTLQIFRELPNGSFSTTPEVTKVLKTDIASTETVPVDFHLGTMPGGFVPQVYADLNRNGAGYVVNDWFQTMMPNVTPKYKIVVSVGGDQNPYNDTTFKVVRFYIQKSPMRLLVSAENSMAFINSSSTTNEVAGRLNYDSLMKGMKRIGWYVDLDLGRYDFDVFDRLGWEPKAVNYPMYRTMVWSDGDDKPLTRYERIDMRRFLAVGNEMEKKNLVIGSQEMVRQLSTAPNADPLFLQDVTRALNVAPGNPLGAGVSNDGNWVIGKTVEEGISESIIKTAHPQDVLPYCGLLTTNPVGQGVANPAYYYFNRAAGVNDSLMGVSNITLTKNVLTLGVDWRHWANISMGIRAFVDFVEKNGGQFVPVELVNFNAVPVGNRVNVNWMTSSELNTDRFEVERATMNEAGKSSFTKIGEEKAAGTSEAPRNYGPVVDRTVTAGNTYVYRLKTIDLNGEWGYSEERIVNMEADNMVIISEVSPNPAENGNNIKIEFSINKNSNVDLSLYDLSGKKITTIFNGSLNAGGNVQTLNTSNLANGAYTIILNVDGYQTTAQVSVIK